MENYFNENVGNRLMINENIKLINNIMIENSMAQRHIFNSF